MVVKAKKKVAMPTNTGPLLPKTLAIAYWVKAVVPGSALMTAPLASFRWVTRYCVASPAKFWSATMLYCCVIRMMSAVAVQTNRVSI